MRKIVILQNPATYETRSVLSACMLHDGFTPVHSTYNQLDHYKEDLLDGAVPVGSVEFVRRAMSLAAVIEPASMSYPEQARTYLKRKVWQEDVERLIGPVFVKPVATKSFNGFIFDARTDISDLSEHDQEQRRKLMRLPNGTKVWASTPVVWASEWRFYIEEGCIRGVARYDENEPDGLAPPDRDLAERCVRSMNLSHPYAMDLGVLSSGETALVEVNDFWAIGLYGKSLHPLVYLRMLCSRWAEMYAANRDNFSNRLVRTSMPGGVAGRG